MRDGVTLYTAIYTPRDQSVAWPILMNRTCYSCDPYGENSYPARLGPSAIMDNEGYIFVKQDVRGRWNSEGTFDNMRPHRDGDLPVDESSDTYDTIEWLLKNVPGNNGKVGITGISYPGFYSAAALPEHHPALVAVSPQAPISDFFFDDFHHQGSFLQSYFEATATFGYQHKGPTTQQWYSGLRRPTNDAWQFHTMLGPLSNASQYYGKDCFFWQEIVEHPNYDKFWQERSILPHLKNVKANVLTVGGWFDAEDLYGPLHIYQSVEEKNPGISNQLVMGPWGHGDWSRGRGPSVVGDMPFGRDISRYFQEKIEAPFFKHHLKGAGDPLPFEAHLFDTGRRVWESLPAWPPADAVPTKLFMTAGGKLGTAPPAAEVDARNDFTQYISDPANPVPYRDRKNIQFQFTPRQYMTDDQRFATKRDDVLVFQTEVLTRPVTMAGPLTARLQVSTDQGDADWIVKVIDVFPDDYPQLEGARPDTIFSGYQMMVRSEVLKGRFRKSLEHPEPMVPNQVTEVAVPLQDVYHTFEPGHRIMIQIQSTWFPLFDRNPQKYVENIYKAKAEDFTKATHRVWHNTDHPSALEFLVPVQEK
jgi:putative CocE/NonD family hydrolase